MSVEIPEETGGIGLTSSLAMSGRLDTETRWAIIREWKRKPLSDRAIARLLSVNHVTVRNTINRYQQTGDVDELPGRGRKRKLEEGVVKKRLRRNSRMSTKVLARELKREGKADVHYTTVWRQGKREGLRWRVKKKKPQLTEGDEEARLAFAQSPRPQGFWRRVVATDEKCIQLGGEVRGEWVGEGEEASTRAVKKFQPGVKVWAGSSWEGKTPIYFLPKSMKGGDYLKFIKEKVEPDMLRLYPTQRRRPVWLQDREGFHTATVVQDYLKKSPIIPLQHWPSHSPDLNWQENVWEVLEQGVRVRNPTTLDGLKKVVKEEWAKIDMPTIQKCVSSMERRLEAVVAANGGNTKY